MTVTIESVDGLPYYRTFHPTVPSGGGGWGQMEAFPASFPATYEITIDVHRSVTETFRVGFGFNTGNQSVHATVHEDGDVNIEKEDRPLAIPGRSLL